jgi:chromate transporter
MTPPPGSSALLPLARAWLVVSTQSIGGGPSVLLLMRRLMVERYGWVTHRQFLEDYAISKMSLGINLIAFAGLIGWRVARYRGVVLSVLGLIVPAGIITLVMTAAYVGVQNEPLVRAAISGAGPAAAGLTIGTGITFARQGVRRGWRSAIDYSYAAVALLAAFALGARPIAILGAGVLVGAILLRGEPSRASADPSL